MSALPPPSARLSLPGEAPSTAVIHRAAPQAPAPVAHATAQSQPRVLAGAIVDLDGTMVDTLGDFDVAIQRALAAMGLPEVPRAFVERTIGKGSENLIRRTLAEVGAEPDRFETLWRLYQQHYLAINGQHAAVYAGVEDGLQAMRRRGWALACVTNKPLAFAQALLQQKGLDTAFAVVYGGDSFERKKPDPLPLLKACAALGTTPAQTLVVGDSSNDAEAARAAGCPVVLVRGGYNHGQPVEAAHPDGILDSLAQLERWLAENAGPSQADSPAPA